MNKQEALALIGLSQAEIDDAFSKVDRLEVLEGVVSRFVGRNGVVTTSLRFLPHLSGADRLGAGYAIEDLIRWVNDASSATVQRLRAAPSPYRSAPDNAPPSWVPTATEDLKPGALVSGRMRNNNRYAVESVTPARFSPNECPPSFIVVLGIPGTEGACIALRAERDDTWWVWA